MRLLQGATIIHGSKGGGGSAHTPVEQPDDLLSVAKLKLLLAISEGEIQGDLTAQQIFLNDTPLANDDGTYNFTGVKWEYRTGTQDQTYIQGLPEIDNELSIGVQVKQASPWVRQFTNLTLDAVRVKLSLPAQYAYKDNGDMVGTVTQYAIDLSVDGGAWQQVVDGTFNGKTTSEYQRDHRIDLPAATTGWSVRVRRITADSTSATKLVNAFSVFSVAEVIDSKLRHPNTALLYLELDSSQFNGSVPKTTCKPKGKLVRVPTTYDPATRTYSGTWTGDFRLAYTNNPAWIFYDLVLDEIYGMGNRVDATMIDKWELYAIAQYCDEMVSDGAGGTEPRFTCNAYIQSQQDAYTVLKDIAAIFRGITFWGNDQIYVKADVPQDDVDFVYHVSNVIDGLFTYAGGSYKNRYTSCQVSWSDPQNHYSDTIEGVYDTDLVQRYRVNETQLTAIGCTSQSEAHRRGRWAILSNAKDGTISFGVGLDGYIPLPAEIIGVADPFRAGKQNGGRVSAVNGLSFTLDRAVDYAAGDRLVLNLPDGTAQTRTIARISADKKTVTVSTAYNQTPVAGAVWAIDSDNLAIQYFRVTSISSNDDGTFTVAGVQHDPNKYRYIDDGVKIDPAPITVTPPGIMQAPKNIVITEVDHIAQGLTVASMQVTWDKADNAISYTAQWRKDNGDWVNVGQTSSQGFTIQGIYAGVYDVRVRSVNAMDVSSPWGYAESTTLSGKVGKPGTPVNLTATDDVVWHINLTWGFPDGSGDTATTEIQQATTADGQNPQFLVSVAYPGTSYQHGPMPAGVRRWYRARLVDRIGNVGDWTDFVEGASSVDATALLGDITEQVLQTDAGKQLIARVDSAEDAIKEVDEAVDGLNTSVSKAQEDIDSFRKELDQNQQDVEAVSAAITAESKTRTDADTALGQRITDVKTTSDDNASRLTTVEQTVADNQSATAQRLDSLDASAEENAASITAEQKARADADSALSQSISQVKSTTDSNEAAIGELQSAQTSAEEALATLTQNTEANFDSSALAAIENALANDKDAQSQRATAGETRARVSTVEKAQADANGAFAEYQRVVSARFNQTDASITTLETAQADANTAFAQYQQTVSAQFKDTNATVQQTSSAFADLNGKLSAQYSVKVAVDSNGRQYMAGMGIGVENSPSGMQTQVLFLADRFAVMTQAGAAPTAVFAIQNGQTIINNAIIGEGTITSAMIAAYIQSTNYVAGAAGWRLGKDGTFERNAANGAGRVVDTGILRQVYDGNGTLRIRDGIW